MSYNAANMSNQTTTYLSKRTQTTILRDFRKKFDLTLRFVTPNGRLMNAQTSLKAERTVALDRLRAHAMDESVRWGEPYSFFLAPGLVSWMVPGVQGEQVIAGLMGTVLSDDEPDTIRDVMDHLIANGSYAASARELVKSLPVWPQQQIYDAVSSTYDMLYRTTGWKPDLLTSNRARAAQQREIADEIHRRKLAQDYGHPVDEERRLLAQIRGGDRKAARGTLNSFLGIMFLSSPNPVVIKARAIELLGYLVRAAVENSPHLEPLIDKNHRWTAALIMTHEFEDLTHVLGQALDDFMDNVYLLGTSSGNASVRNALAFIADHFRSSIELSQVAQAAGLSSHRIAHLLKETTGHSFLQHVHRLRIDAARRLLEDGDMSCTDIGYAVGYNDQSYFIRHFRRLTGMTPGHYKRGRRK
ncbi:MAG: helix-turn-helix domain-containing protein [Proteobacteria bacterium]|nr:helix-turn-helix domain-containing protein [Pseudomonadota bacterium]